MTKKEQLEKEEQLTNLLDELGNKKFTFIRAYLFSKANSYASDIKALSLHKTCNALLPVINELDPTDFID